MKSMFEPLLFIAIGSSMDSSYMPPSMREKINSSEDGSAH